MNLKKLKLSIESEQCKRSFYEFVKQSFHLAAINQQFQDSQLMRVLCQFCEDIYYGNIKKSVINVPPSVGKSTIISILFPVWCWIRDPSIKIICVSYTPSISHGFAEKSLDLLKSDWFKSRFSIQLRNENQTAKGYYKNTQGGWRLGTSPGSKLTSYHADIILIDDPVKANDSKKVHQSVIDFFKNTLPTRFINKSEGRTSLIMQRLAYYDPAQYALDNGWKSLVLPMKFDPKRADPLDWRKTSGELLLPERLDSDAVQALELELGIYAPAQLQQNPHDTQSSIFKPEHLNNKIPKDFNLHPELDCCDCCISIDLATYGKETSDFSALVFAFKYLDNYYIYKDYLFKLDFAEQVQEILNVYNEFKKYNPKVIVENKANGPALVSMIEKAGINIEEFNPGSKSKLERANSISYLLNLGCVFFGDLSEEAKTQLLHFPKGKHDDAVDSCTQALLYLSKNKTKSVWEILIEKKK